jgi:hypothetical protein
MSHDKALTRLGAVTIPTNDILPHKCNFTDPATGRIRK